MMAATRSKTASSFPCPEYKKTVRFRAPFLRIDFSLSFRLKMTGLTTRAPLCGADLAPTFERGLAKIFDF
jgi:hypothetical protein